MAAVEEESVDGGEIEVDECGEGGWREGGGAIAPGLSGEKGAKASSLSNPCISSHDGDEITIAESPFWGDGDLTKKKIKCLLLYIKFYYN